MTSLTIFLGNGTTLKYDKISNFEPNSAGNGGSFTYGEDANFKAIPTASHLGTPTPQTKISFSGNFLYQEK